LAAIVSSMERVRVLAAGLMALIVAACGGASAANAQQYRGVNVDPQGLIRPALLRSALESYERHASSGLRSNVMAIADFAQRSSARRFYIVDLQTGAVTPMLVAHGKGSDPNHDGVADRFSNATGSHASSLGAYRAAARYQGGHGLSLALDGLEPGNRNARSRAIVVHSNWYVSDQAARANGKIGRSYGCFVVDRAKISDVVRRLEGGGFLYAGR
jgi:hypothetical protein